ncbi:MAG TPA: YifB family Mg chelatase-like AAA ATPase [Euzebya sp.]|nr:YifB family Mg chelatase-like AAA ATPase [Euzebya sp.]
MSLGVAWSVALEGLQPTRVRVEAHVGQGLPAFTVLGISGASGAQASERVRAALAAVGHHVGQRKVLVNLAPADVAKRGARYDLAIAAAVLRALEEIPPDRAVLLGELALNGDVRQIAGVLPSVIGHDHVTVAAANAGEAVMAGVAHVTPVATLREFVAIAAGKVQAPPPPAVAPSTPPEPPDLADVRGQCEARRALEIAAAGRHHLLLLGPPGAGKSMLARRLPGLLPPLQDAEALTVASVRSVAGRSPLGQGLDRVPPFAAPHHSASTAALLGGGSGLARPGAVSEATHGVLFLDELFEWSRHTLDSLREPLEEGTVRLARTSATVTYPAAVLLVGAGNLCPCGPGRGGCRCRDDVVTRYRARLTGPLADRFDLAPLIEPVPAQALSGPADGERSAVVATRVAAARQVAMQRFGQPNARTAVALVRRTARPAAVDVLVRAAHAGRLSARGFDRALRVARTCADLAGSDLIGPEDAHEAVAHRSRLDQVWDVAA